MKGLAELFNEDKNIKNMEEEKKIEFLLQMVRYNKNFAGTVVSDDVVVFTDRELKKIKKELFKLLGL